MVFSNTLDTLVDKSKRANNNADFINRRSGARLDPNHSTFNGLT